MAGQADYVFDPGIAFPHVRAGKVRMLAVAGAKRSSFFPDVPTLAEIGFKGAELDIWFGMWAPNGIPAEVSARMATEIAKALTLREYQNSLRDSGRRTCRSEQCRIQEPVGQRSEATVWLDQGNKNQYRLTDCASLFSRTAERAVQQFDFSMATGR